MIYKFGPMFLPFCHKSGVRQTDGQTDEQTEFSSLVRVCIACSAVKTNYKLARTVFCARSIITRKGDVSTSLYESVDSISRILDSAIRFVRTHGYRCMHKFRSSTYNFVRTVLIKHLVMSLTHVYVLDNYKTSVIRALFKNSKLAP